MTSTPILSTARLELREMTESDLPALRRILQDPVVMRAYEGAFSEEMIRDWLDRMLTRYEVDGIGLWAVVERSRGRMIGQCGLTRQPMGDRMVTEVGYLFERSVWGNGFAVEAATACRDYAFQRRGVDRVWAHVRDTNVASMNVAIRVGMTVRERFIKHYRGVTMPHLAFAVDRLNAVAT